jgi:hypothetical protein
MTAKGSLPTFAAFAHRENWVAALSVRFRQVAQFSLRAQRKSGFRPSCRNVHGAASVTIGPLKKPLRGTGAFG